MRAKFGHFSRRAAARLRAWLEAATATQAVARAVARRLQRGAEARGAHLAEGGVRGARGDAGEAAAHWLAARVEVTETFGLARDEPLSDYLG